MCGPLTRGSSGRQCYFHLWMPEGVGAFEERRRPATGAAEPSHVQAARGGVWFKCGGQELHLGVEEPFSPARKAHPALVFSDFEALIRKLREAGVAVSEDDTIPGVRRAFVADPFGNRVELVSL
jgi:catechol 2,3-dioxygenase-like lactoylglutathione lyase family enzyme